MSSNNDERRYKYYIPDNFTNSAKLFGFIRLRNAIELLIIVGGLALIEFNCINASLKTRLIIMCVTIVPIAIFIVMGIDGCSITEYLQRMIKAYVDKKYIVKREVYQGVQERAHFARTSFKEKKQKKYRRKSGTGTVGE